MQHDAILEKMCEPVSSDQKRIDMMIRRINALKWVYGVKRSRAWCNGLQIVDTDHRANNELVEWQDR
jgi:hypothetical protein